MNRPNRIRTEMMLILCAVLGVSSVAAAQVVCTNYHTVALPNYSGLGGNPGSLAGGYPHVSQYDVVWTGWTGPLPPGVGGRPEIFRFDGTTTSQVTSNINASGNWQPFISPLNRIVYIGDTGTANDLFMYDIGTGTATQLTFATGRWPMVVTDFSDHSISPRITVEVMDQWLGSPWAPTWITVDLWDGTQIITLSPRLFNYGSQVSPYRVVWHASNILWGAYDIFLYEMASTVTTQMTTAAPGWAWRDPQLSDPYIVWWGTDYSQTQITLCNLNQGISYRHTVASCNSYKEPKLANAAEHVVWSWANDSGIFDEVWHHAHTPPFHLTTQIFPGPMDIHGTVDCIDASYPYAAFAVQMPGGGPYEIYVYDLVNLGTPQRVAMGISSSPIWLRISTKLIPPYGYIPVVIWEENLGSMAAQAYMATRPECSACVTADFTNDCGVNSADLAIMGTHWGQADGCDLNGDNIINFADLLILTTQWLNCNVQPPIYCWRAATFSCP